MSIPITLTGNLTRDPELRPTSSGKLVASFGVATSGRRKNEATGQWEDTDTSFWNCSAFGELAENICESCFRGTRVMIMGKIKMREYTPKGEDKPVKVPEVMVDEVALSLKFAKASVSSNGHRQKSKDLDEVPF